MSHEEVTDLLALDAIGALEASDREAMERHVATCATCQPLLAQYADVASLLPVALEPVPPPARLRRTLMAQVYAEATAEGQLPSRGQPPWWRRLAASIPANRGLTAIGAAAVVAAIALGIWGAAGRLAGPSPAVHLVYSVSGTTATGNLDVTAGMPAVLTVSGLDPLPASEVYEVWLVPRQGAPKGVAFLSPGVGSGSWTAVIPGNLTPYKTIAATVEPAGGSATPSQTEVLSGQLSES